MVGATSRSACQRVRRPADTSREEARGPHAPSHAVLNLAGGVSGRKRAREWARARALAPSRDPSGRRKRRKEGAMQPRLAETQTAPSDGIVMQVRKRSGELEPVDVNKIVRAVQRWAGELDDVEPLRVARKTVSGLYEGATSAELDRLSMQSAAELIAEEPQYSRLAARLLSANRRGGRAAGHRLVQRVHRARPRRGPDRRRDLRVRQGQRAQARRRRSTTPATCASSTSACARSTTATCCATRPRR